MGSKLNKICELSAEVGKAVLIMQNKDEQIAGLKQEVSRLNADINMMISARDTRDTRPVTDKAMKDAHTQP